MDGRVDRRGVQSVCGGGGREKVFLNFCQERLQRVYERGMCVRVDVVFFSFSLYFVLFHSVFFAQLLYAHKSSLSNKLRACLDV